MSVSPYTLLTIGLVLLCLEVMLGFTTIILLLAGVAFLIVSVLVGVGLISGLLGVVLIAVAVSLAVVTVLAWKPMKSLQNGKQVTLVTSDLIGETFIINEGVDWSVMSNKDIKSGSEVKIMKVEVGVLQVESI
jgi:membrane protein implicated in regulation of membrane protease activity